MHTHHNQMPPAKTRPCRPLPRPAPGHSRRIVLLMLFTAAAGAALISHPRAVPPSETSLDRLMHQELSRKPDPAYGFRCTMGAHRGASTEHLENTFAALLAAEESEKYAFIEFDVQYSRDKQIVVFHDNRLLRLFGSLKTIADTTFAELRELTGGEIAAYDDVMDSLGKKINIEIKSSGDPGEDRLLADELIADIRLRGREKDVLISSISREVIRYINDSYPAIATGLVYWLTASTYLHFDSLTEGLFEDLEAARADYLMLHVANLRNIDDLLRLKPEGKTIVFWDFDDSMYLVHKDLGDRLWGDSGITAFMGFLRFKLYTTLERRGPDGMGPPFRHSQIRG